MPTRKPIRMLDLFSGIGGFSLAAQRVFGDDLEIVGFCEREPFCQKVLQKNFPGVPIHNDITELDGSEFEDIDLLTGGFPCQDISVAGAGRGIIDGERSSLWFEMQRIISRVRPKFAVIENVPALTYRGGVEVIRSLAESGYDAEWQIISAKQIGARHLRKRIWIVAYPRHRSWRNLQSRDAGLCGRQQTEKTIGNTTSTQASAGQGISKNDKLIVKESGVIRKINKKGNDFGLTLSRHVMIEDQMREDFPTPTASMHKGSGPTILMKTGQDRRKSRLDYAIEQSDSRKSEEVGKLNPNWVEWLMGYPIGQTDLKDWETQ